MKPPTWLIWENAELDVEGGFHVSTADVLEFEGGGELQLALSPVVPGGHLEQVDHDRRNRRAGTGDLGLTRLEGAYGLLVALAVGHSHPRLREGLRAQAE